MERIELHLTDEQFTSIQRDLVRGKSSNTGKLAMAIAEIHCRSLYPDCTFQYNLDDADLVVTTADIVIALEVKGTETINNIWTGLVINGDKSHQKITSGMPIYRVTGVYDRSPSFTFSDMTSTSLPIRSQGGE
ncbi:hypothetical protein [Pseudomonas sp. PDM19]|uniref:hypothetical protein n=1 Tax=Pseudomonas sp. PDM19 TaxID=2769272 RepID=UPI00177E9E63|nr:hypothetical protein [Pseudomonas sp. PDM19]MBD9634607.1 hypothetical protein [Pseudomonas sp. PDM19]